MAVKEIKDMGASVLTRLKKQAKESCFERWDVLIYYFKL